MGVNDRKQKGVRRMLCSILPRASLAAISGRASTARVISSTATRALFSTTSTINSSNIRPGYAAIKEKQKYFNIDNGKRLYDYYKESPHKIPIFSCFRVHERGGAKDDIMYNITLLIILVGLVEWCR